MDQRKVLSVGNKYIGVYASHLKGEFVYFGIWLGPLAFHITLQKMPNHYDMWFNIRLWRAKSQKVNDSSL